MRVLGYRFTPSADKYADDSDRTCRLFSYVVYNAFVMSPDSSASS